MEIRLFGPMLVRVSEASLETGPPRQRAVFAALAIDAGRTVLVDCLVDRVWGTEPPRRVRDALYVYVGRLRAALGIVNGGKAPLVRRSGGYVLDIDRDCVDLCRFGDLIAMARERERSDIGRASALRQALGLWVGTPLADVSGDWAARVRGSAERQRVEAAVEWAQIELRLGRADRIVVPLTELADEHPLVEPVAGLLMRALHAVGRGAEALDRYTTIRTGLVDQLGLEPGPELHDVHRVVLRGDPAAALVAPVPAAAPSRARAALPAPAQLPRDNATFTGRTEHLRQLDQMLEPAEGVGAAAITGTAGVGKTSLAVHWAHRMRDRFPDGQLYVNLRGFDPSGAVLPTAAVIRDFLEALGVHPADIPQSIEAQGAMYRSLLDGRRILVVLDNALDADQVRPLLPGTSHAMAVVTSRDQLASLVAVDGAVRVPLAPLARDEARHMLARRLGHDRVEAELGAVDEIIDRCARLPLALAIAAGRAADPSLSIATVAVNLADAGQRLDALSAGDAVSEVRTVFSWSYAGVSPGAAGLFRLLSLHPGPDISAAAAASLAGIAPSEAQRCLAELAQASLLNEHVPGRYAYHDLLRLYATDLARATDAARGWRAATDRMLDHYLYTACAMDRIMDPHRDPVAPALTGHGPGVTPEATADVAQSMAWFAAERPILLAGVRLASDNGQYVDAWRLAWSMTTYLSRRGPWHDLNAVWQTALHAAERLGDRAMRAGAHRELAHTYTELGRHEDARREHQCALDLYAEIGDHVGRAETHRRLANLCEREGRLEHALDHAQESLTLYRRAGQGSGEACALNGLGWFHALLGDHAQALAHCKEALTLLCGVGDRQGQADTWDSLGYIHSHLDDHDEAVACFRRALELYRSLGDRYHEAATLVRLGETYQNAARLAWQQSLDTLTDLEHWVAEAVRRRLQHLDDQTNNESWLPRRVEPVATANPGPMGTSENYMVVDQP